MKVVDPFVADCHFRETSVQEMFVLVLKTNFLNCVLFVLEVILYTFSKIKIFLLLKVLI